MCIRDRYYPYLNTAETSYFPITEKSMWNVKKQCKVLDLKIKSVLQLPIALAATEGWTVRVNKKTNGKYRNYDFVEVVARGEDDSAPARTEEKNSDIPF